MPHVRCSQGQLPGFSRVHAALHRQPRHCSHCRLLGGPSSQSCVSVLPLLHLSLARVRITEACSPACHATGKGCHATCKGLPPPPSFPRPLACLASLPGPHTLRVGTPDPLANKVVRPDRHDHRAPPIGASCARARCQRHCMLPTCTNLPHDSMQPHPLRVQCLVPFACCRKLMEMRRPGIAAISAEDASADSRSSLDQDTKIQCNNSIQDGVLGHVIRPSARASTNSG